MKTKILFKIFAIFVILITINIHNVFAGEEELRMPSERDGLFTEFGVEDVKAAIELFDADGDGHISVEEFQTKIDSGEDVDKVDNALTVFRSYPRLEKDPKFNHYINALKIKEGNEMKDNPELIELIRNEHNRRRREVGLGAIDDSNLDKYVNMAKYYEPDKVDNSGSSAISMEDVFNDATSFMEQENTKIQTIEESDLQTFSSSFYNILLAIGTAGTVIAGIIIGIKYMLASVEARADIKQMLIPYVVGCVVVYGSFAIWKAILEIMAMM